MDDEADLMRRLGRDEDAFEAVYRAHVRRVAAYAARRCATPEDVADVVAQTFVRLLRQADRYDVDRGSVAAFVHALAASEVGDQRRRHARRARLAERVAGRALLSDDDVARLEDVMDARRRTAELAPALAALPTGEDQVLRLVAAGLTPSEAAARLAITPDAARARLSRARRRLRTTRPEEAS